MPEIREQVRWFVGKMEEQLQANEHKGGWGDSPNAPFIDSMQFM